MNDRLAAECLDEWLTDGLTATDRLTDWQRLDWKKLNQRPAEQLPSCSSNFLTEVFLGHVFFDASLSELWDAAYETMRIQYRADLLGSVYFID